VSDETIVFYPLLGKLLTISSIMYENLIIITIWNKYRHQAKQFIDSIFAYTIMFLIMLSTYRIIQELFVLLKANELMSLCMLIIWSYTDSILERSSDAGEFAAGVMH
jgi:uncharacterized membrane protein YqjE